MPRTKLFDRWWRRWLGVALSAVMCAATVGAQSQRATLEGTVHDSTGGSISEAEVLVREAETNQTRTTVTARDGSFRIPDLPVGTYEIRLEYDGFDPYQHGGITLAIGQTARLDIELRPAGVAESVTVRTQPSPLDSAQTSVATTIDTERIEELPVRSRNYLDFVLLAPGVVRSNVDTRSGGSSLPNSGFSFGGLRPRSNMLTIDGLDNNDEFSGASRTELSLEIVREFQVVNHGWTAENGGASGGAINVVTKSGANTTHGDAFVFAQPGALNARPKLEDIGGVKPALLRYRAGIAIGGPVVKDRAFYYTAFEREHARGEAASDIERGSASAINGALASGLFPDLTTRQLTSGLFPTLRDETEWSAKATRQLTGRGAWVTRFALTDGRDDNDAFNAGGLSDLSARGTNATADRAVTSSWATTLGSRTTNDLRGQVATRRVDAHTTDQHGPGVTIAGVADFGTPYWGNSTHDQRYLQMADTVGWIHRTHFVKAGADVQHVSVSGTTTDGHAGKYAFRALSDFLGRRPDSFRQMLGGTGANLAVTRPGAFVQDRWGPTSAFTLDFGVRFDASVFSPRFRITHRELSPRLGVAWTPTPEWIIRGGAGTFSDRLVLAAFERASLLERQQPLEHIVGPSSVAAPSIYTVRTGAWAPSSRQVSIGAERQLTANLTASINYLFVAGRHLPRTVNTNLPPPVMLTVTNAAALGVAAPVPQQLGRLVFGTARLDPRWDGSFELQPTASSTYRGVTVAFNRRLANEVEWSAGYTWSHARDTASDFDEQPQNPYALDDEWGNSRYDQRHRLVVNALFDVPIGEDEDRQPGEVPGAFVRAFSHISVAPIFTAASGRPVNVITGADDNLTHAFPYSARPLNVVRNSLRLPGSVTLDLRILKYFPISRHGKLDLVFEAFNLLNRTNVTQVNAVFGPLLTPRETFGRPIEADPSRQVQLSIDFEF